MKRYYSVASRNNINLSFSANAQGGNNNMSNKRITSNLSPLEILYTMSEGNQEAFTCLQEMVLSDSKSLLEILSLDDLEIYGSNIYVLWDKCCDRDITILKKTLKYFKDQNVSKEEIHEKLAQVPATPFVS